MIGSPAGILKELEEAEARPDEPALAAPPAHKPAPAEPSLEASRANQPAPAEPAPAAPPGSLPTPGAPAPAAPPPGYNPAPPGTQSDAGMLKSEAIGKILDKPVKLSIAKETPLADVLKSVKEAAQAAHGSEIQIYVDPTVSPLLKRGVEFDLEGILLRTTLSLLLSQVGLNWTVQDGLIIVSTDQGLQNYRRIASHFSRAFGALDQLYVAPGGMSEEFLAKFDAPITLSFPQETPLDEVLKAIREATKAPGGPGIPVFYGPPAIIWEAMNTHRPAKIGMLPVRIDVKDVPLRTCLALLFAPQGPTRDLGNGMAAPPGPSLDGRLLDGLLIIGTQDWVGSLSVPQGFAPGGIGGGMGGMGGQGMR
jgi:hypothetical protein